MVHCILAIRTILIQYICIVGCLISEVLNFNPLIDLLKIYRYIETVYSVNIFSHHKRDWVSFIKYIMLVSLSIRIISRFLANYICIF